LFSIIFQCPPLSGPTRFNFPSDFNLDISHSTHFTVSPVTAEKSFVVILLSSIKEKPNVEKRVM